jgi:hypothetical protein
MKKQDMIFCMNTAMVECSIQNKIDIDDLYIIESKKEKNTFYIVDKVRTNEKGFRKCWFKKTFN